MTKQGMGVGSRPETVWPRTGMHQNYRIGPVEIGDRTGKRGAHTTKRHGTKMFRLQ